MPERKCTRRRALFEGATFALACVCKGCSILEDVEDDSIPQPSVRFTEVELDVGIWRWRSTVPPNQREVIDKELMWGKNLLVHTFLGHIPKEQSRGSMSTFAKQARKDGWCTRHPESEDIPWHRNWDLMYDPQAAAYWEERLKIPHPIEVSMHHEFFGHILAALRDPNLMDRVKDNPELKDDEERKALAIENEYRRHLGLAEVPEKLIYPEWYLRQHPPKASTP